MRGGYGTSDHGSLADRNRGAAPRQDTGPETGQETSQPVGPARHCHVEGQPSLLVEWRQGPTGWEGRVVSVVWLDATGWASIERWLPATQIER